MSASSTEANGQSRQTTDHPKTAISDVLVFFSPFLRDSPEVPTGCIVTPALAVITCLLSRSTFAEGLRLGHCAVNKSDYECEKAAVSRARYCQSIVCFSTSFPQPTFKRPSREGASGRTALMLIACVWVCI